MRVAVSATRMELIRLRRRLVLARRGHKLLKDKQEQLMRRLLELVAEIRQHRARVRAEMRQVLARFALARQTFPPEFLEAAVLVPTRKVEIEVATRRLMNLEVPVFRRRRTGRLRAYGFLTTSMHLDAALLGLDRILDALFDLAEKEKTLELLATELERTRRRVNALEYVLLPSLEETIRAIAFRLAETERQDLTRLMRVKELIRGEERGAG